MTTTTRNAMIALVCSMSIAATPAAVDARPSPDQSRSSLASQPPRDDALGNAVLEIIPEPDPTTEPESPPAPAPEDAYGDPYGFAAIINQFRASAGLPPLAYDPNLSAWASQNNAAQCVMGLGHHVLSGFSQNCGYNQSTIYEIAQSWMASPAHARNMLDPASTRFGIAYGPGPYWTMNAQ